MAGSSPPPSGSRNDVQSTASVKMGLLRRASREPRVSNRLHIGFFRHIEVCVFLCQLLLEHLADMRVLVTVLDGVAALFDVEIQTPPIDTRYTLDSPRIAAQEGQHTQRFLGCAEVTVKPAGIARRRAHDAARLVVLSLDQFALAVRPRRRPRLARPRDGVALAA